MVHTKNVQNCNSNITNIVYTILEPIFLINILQMVDDMESIVLSQVDQHVFENKLLILQVQEILFVPNFLLIDEYHWILYHHLSK